MSVESSIRHSGSFLDDCRRCKLKGTGVCEPAAKLREAYWEGKPDETDTSSREATKAHKTGECRRVFELNDALGILQNNR